MYGLPSTDDGGGDSDDNADDDGEDNGEDNADDDGDDNSGENGEDNGDSDENGVSVVVRAFRRRLFLVVWRLS